LLLFFIILFLFSIVVKKPVGVYRPPGARGRNTPSNILHKDVKTGSQEIISAKRTIPGYAPPQEGIKIWFKNIVTKNNY